MTSGSGAQPGELSPRLTAPGRANCSATAPRKAGGLAAMILGSSVAEIDSTVVAVALPTIGRDLHVGFQGLQWIVTSYTLTLASLILLAGSLSDRWGRRRVFLAGLGWFTVASVLCAAAPGIGWLIAARAVQHRRRADDTGQPGDHRGDLPAPATARTRLGHGPDSAGCPPRSRPSSAGRCWKWRAGGRSSSSTSRSPRPSRGRRGAMSPNPGTPRLRQRQLARRTGWWRRLGQHALPAGAIIAPALRPIAVGRRLPAGRPINTSSTYRCYLLPATTTACPATAGTEQNGIGMGITRQARPPDGRCDDRRMCTGTGGTNDIHPPLLCVRRGAAGERGQIERGTSAP